MRYAFVQAHTIEWRVKTMCRVLVVSKAGYYAWRKRAICERGKRDTVLHFQVVAFHRASSKRYGSRPIVRDLRDIGQRVGRNRVARIMRAAGVSGKRRRAFRVTTNSKHSHPIPGNHLDRHFAPKDIEGTNRVWAGDITYIPTREGWLYLAVVLDLFSRRVIGWSMSHSLEARLVLDALQMAVDSRRMDGAVLFHTDRGVQYACDAMQRFHERHALVGSMSRKGNCWDNAVVESFFSTLKRELDDKTFESRESARAELFEYIEIWYNRKRRHSTLGYVSPERFEQDQAA
jgi:putative transposase